MLIASMGKMMETLAPSSVHLLNPQPPRNAVGLNQQIYEQMRRDFMVAGPFVLHAEVPELLAASWSLVRETLFVGEVPRGEKEIIAWGVSKANQCPFCIDAHYAAVRATSAENRALENWALASVNGPGEAHVSPPFDAYTAEYFGTLAAFHYLNRMVSVFLDEKMMPLPRVLNPVTHSMAKLMMGGMIEKGANNVSGDSLPLIPDFDDSLSWKPDWAQSNSHIQDAVFAWSGTAETVARDRLDDNLRDAVGRCIDNWQGDGYDSIDSSMNLMVDIITPQQLPAAHLALLTAFAPYRVTNAELHKAQASVGSEQNLLALVAWSAQRVTRRICD